MGCIKVEGQAEANIRQRDAQMEAKSHHIHSTNAFLINTVSAQYFRHIVCRLRRRQESTSFELRIILIRQ